MVESHNPPQVSKRLPTFKVRFPTQLSSAQGDNCRTCSHKRGGCWCPANPREDNRRIDGRDTAVWRGRTLRLLRYDKSICQFRLVVVWETVSFPFHERPDGCKVIEGLAGGWRVAHTSNGLCPVCLLSVPLGRRMGVEAASLIEAASAGRLIPRW